MGKVIKPAPTIQEYKNLVADYIMRCTAIHFITLKRVGKTYTGVSDWYPEQRAQKELKQKALEEMANELKLSPQVILDIRNRAYQKALEELKDKSWIE